MPHTRSPLHSLAIAVVFAVLACHGDSLDVPTTGSLQITTTTNGAPPDPDGYTVMIDSAERGTLGVSSQTSIEGLSPGQHILGLSGIAENCAVLDSNPRLVVVSVGATRVVSFVVTCSQPVGTVRVFSRTSGPGQDHYGYDLLLDGISHGSLAANSETTLRGIEPGDHIVGLSGVAANCRVDGDNPRSFKLDAGQNPDLTLVVTCTSPPANPGTLRVTTRTNGLDPTIRGYTLIIDGAVNQPVGINSVMSVNNVTEGAHNVGLSGLPVRCGVRDGNPRDVAVSTGGTTDVSLQIDCSFTTGSITVSVSTSGSLPDLDGFMAVLDGDSSYKDVASTGSVNFTGVRTGAHTVELWFVAPNCTDRDGLSRMVSVSAGATSQVNFVVTCTAGSLEITTTTVGPSPDTDGYVVRVDDEAGEAIGINATRLMPSLGTGSHSVALSSLASNCVVEGSNPVGVSVNVNATTTAAFTISCPTPVEANWTRMASGNTTAFLNRISGTSATNIFVAGPTTILHYDGTAWSTQLQLQTGEIRDVWAASTTDAFALGAGWPSSGPYFLRYDGLEWSSMNSPGVDVEDGSLVAMWGSSSNDVFAVGSRWPYGGYDYTAYIAHFDGTHWSPMETGGADCAGAASRFPCYIQLTGVWGSSGNDVYAVGNFHVPLQDEDQAVILHYDGHRWSEVLRESRLQLYNVWGSSSNDVYATGSTLVPSGQCTGCLTYGAGAIRHFDGSSWSTIPSPTSAGLGAIWGSSSTDIYLLSGDRGSIWHFNGARWTQMTTGVSGLADIWGSSASGMFAVGADGTILHGPQDARNP